MLHHVHVTGTSHGTLATAQLLAHLTLRGGALEGRIVVSASSTDADAAASPTARDAMGHGGEGGAVAAAAAILSGAPADEALAGVEEGEAELLAHVQPYPHLHRSFADAERSLYAAAAKAAGGGGDGVPYFDFVVAADLPAYDAVLDYYNSRRVTDPGFSLSRRLGVLHLSGHDGSRAGPQVQRFLEMLLLPQNPHAASETGADMARGSDGGAAAVDRDAWLDVVDAVMARHSHLLSVDVLCTVL